MSVLKRGKRWHYAFQYEGVRYRGAIPQARTKKQAQAVEAQLRLDLFAGKPGVKRQVPLFTAWAEEYLAWAKVNKRSWRSDVGHVKALCAEFGRLRLDEVLPMRIEQYKRARLTTPTRHGTPRTASTVNRELSTLSRLLGLAIDAGHLTANACQRVRKLRENNQRTTYLTLEQEQRLLFELNGRPTPQALVIMALQTGMRRGELFSLEWRDVDLSRRELQVRQSKTGRGRMIPLNVTAYDVLTNWPRLKGCALVFPNRRTGRKLTNIKRAFTGACRRAGLVDFRFHDLRHTCATRLADAGADAFTIAELLGHADLSMTKRYTHATNERKHAAVAALTATKTPQTENGVTLRHAVNC